jgi:hypothetical protein
VAAAARPIDDALPPAGIVVRPVAPFNPDAGCSLHDISP